MIAPLPIPSELAAGLLGRIGILNGWTTAKYALAMLREHLAGRHGIDQNTPAVYVLASAVGMDPQLFVRMHSLVPAIRAIAPGSVQLPHGDPSNLNVLVKSGMKVDHLNGRLCAKCVEEDNEFWGISYWRLEHQLFGIVGCSKHQIPLQFARVKNPFEYLPEHLLGKSEQNVADESMLADPIVARYCDIMHAFLNEDRPLPLRQVAHLLGKKANAVGLRASSNGKRPLLSDIAVNELPDLWLRRYFPRISGKEKGQFVSTLDGLMASNHTAFAIQNYALAAALLWDSVDEALNEMLASASTDAKAIRQMRFYGPDYWTSSRMSDIYIKHKGSHRKIADEIGVNRNYCRDQLTKYGLPGIGNRAKTCEIGAVLAINSGMKLTEACSRFGVSAENIVRLLTIGSANFIRALDEIFGSSSSTQNRLQVGREAPESTSEEDHCDPSCSFKGDSEILVQ